MRLILCSLLLFMLNKGITQNILVNGGFEEENTCTEYQVNCAPEAWISSSDGFSNYFKDGNRAYDGSHCMAIRAGHSFKPYNRTYIRSQLPCALRKGSRYIISFYLKSPHSLLDSIGILFAREDPLPYPPPMHIVLPNLYAKQGREAFAKDSSWQKVEAIYLATGNEYFIMIGNFSRKDTKGATGIERENNFYVYLDNISLTPVEDGERLCSGWLQSVKQIYEQDARHQFLRRSLRSQKDKPANLELTTNTITRIDTLLLPDVLFETGKKDLHASAEKLLDSLCSYLQGKTVDSIIVAGHTDNTGSTAFNEQLSLGRALAVREYLFKCIQVERKKIIPLGMESRRPVADNRTVAGRQQNRRVEILCYLLQ